MTRRRHGFALVIMLTLLALLVLVVTSVSTVVRVGGDATAVAAGQTAARQHALLGLEMALAELRRSLSDDTRVTAMAGVTGASPSATSTTRHWCGVWRNDGSFVGWLTSGAQSAPTAALVTGVEAMELVADGSVGKSAAQSEHVIAGKVPIVVPETPAAPGATATIGAYAFLICDEGVKLSAYAPTAQLAVPRLWPPLAGVAGFEASQAGAASTLAKVLSYEQLRLAGVTARGLKEGFHHVTLTALTVTPNGLASGMINLNTTSPTVWRSILESYNAAPGVAPPLIDTISSRGEALAGGLAASSSGKMGNGPFTSVAAFGASALLAANLPTTVTPERFMAAVGGLLTVRSDTFRVRAYGEAVNPLEAGKLEAAAWCEAIVQRMPEADPSGVGRRFVVAYFRWLGTDDR